MRARTGSNPLRKKKKQLGTSTERHGRDGCMRASSLVAIRGQKQLMVQRNAKKLRRSRKENTKSVRKT